MVVVLLLLLFLLDLGLWRKKKRECGSGGVVHLIVSKIDTYMFAYQEPNLKEEEEEEEEEEMQQKKQN